MKLLTLALTTFLLSASSAAFAADTNTFDFFVWGKKVGTTTYTLASSKGVTKVSSRVDRHDFPVPMTEEFRIGSDGFVLSGMVTRPNDKFIAIYNPDKQHTKIDVLPSKNGEAQPATTWNLTRPDLLIGLMEDSATWQMLMDRTRPRELWTESRSSCVTSFSCCPKGLSISTWMRTAG
jgi:hypothetical protein